MRQAPSSPTIANRSFAGMDRRRRGFSLVEMLVSVAVIGILAALIIPAAQKSIEKARSAACVSNLRQLYTGFVAYAADNQSCFPFGESTDSSGTVTLNGYFQGDMAKQFKAYIPGGRPDASTGYCAPYLCPSDKDFRGGAGPYGYFGHSYGANAYIAQSANNSARWNKRSSTFLLTDALSTFIFRTSPATNFGPRHSGGANVLFCDGHVEWMKAPLPTSSQNQQFWNPTMN